MGKVLSHIFRYILFSRWHARGLINTSLDVFCVLSGTGGVWSTHVETNFVSSLTLDELVNTGSDAFCVLAGMEGILSTHIEKILNPCIHGTGLVNTS
jgi:hypothetical protein